MGRGSGGYVELFLEVLVGAAVAYFLIGAVYSSGQDRWFWITVLSLIEVGVAALLMRSFLSR